MKTTIIPAQITTVEDKIAGNLSFTQIVLLILALFLSVFIYAVVPVKLQISLFKAILIASTALFLIILSLRVKDRIVLSWLTLLISYWIRPKIYVFDKNDIYLREVINLNTNNSKVNLTKKKAVTIKASKNETKALKLEGILNDPKTKLSFKFGKKGGINVALFEK